MNKIVLPIILGVTLLTACQHSEPKAIEKKMASTIPPTKVESHKNTTFPYPNLLAENEKSYSLLVIGEPANKTPIEKNDKIVKSVQNILSLPTLKMATSIYPELKIESIPSYLLFDENGVVYQSKNQKELSRYLQSNPAK
jgi:hypothetical protein